MPVSARRGCFPGPIIYLSSGSDTWLHLTTLQSYWHIFACDLLPPLRPLTTLSLWRPRLFFGLGSVFTVGSGLRSVFTAGYEFIFHSGLQCTFSLGSYLGSIFIWGPGLGFIFTLGSGPWDLLYSGVCI